MSVVSLILALAAGGSFLAGAIQGLVAWHSADPLLQRRLRPSVIGCILLAIALIVASYYSLSPAQITPSPSTATPQETPPTGTTQAGATLTPTPSPSPTSTPEPIEPTPTPGSVTYHLAGVVDSCRGGAYGGDYRSPLTLTLIISDRTTVTGKVVLQGMAPGEGAGDITGGSIDANNYLTFDSGAVITFHWNGTLANGKVLNGTVYPFEGRCKDSADNDKTGQWAAT